MRSRAVFILLVVASIGAVLAHGTVASAGSDVVYFEENFEGDSWHTSGTWANWLSGGYLAKTSVPGVEGDATRITMKPGRHDAAMLNYQFAREGHTEPDEAWFRYWMRFDDLPEDSGKLPGFMSLYSDSGRGHVKPSESKPGWSARVLYAPGDAGKNVRLGYYLYWLGQSQTNGDGLWWSKQVPLDQWVCVEGHVAMNTPGSDNGELDAWIDGASVYSRSDVRYRTASQSSVHIRDFMFEVWYGGAPTPPADTSVSFDDLAVANHRIGCDLDPAERFEDVTGSPFVADIEWLADVGVTKGCNPPANTRFCPTGQVTRGQMAAFLRRALEDLITVPELPDPPANPPSIWGVESSDYKASLGVMESAGHPVDLIHLEYPLSGGDWLAQGDLTRSLWVPLQLSNIWNAGAVPYIEFYDSNISGFVGGSFDAEFDGWLDTITGWLLADPDRRALIVPFPDANTKSASYGDSAPAFRAAYEKVHDAIRARGVGPDQARFVFQMSAELNSNRYAKSSVGSGFGIYAPDRDLIDLAAVSWLNTGSPTWQDWDALFSARVAEMNGRVGVDIPVLLSIVASAPSGGGETRSGWFADVVDGIEHSKSAIGFVYLDKDRSIDYAVGTTGAPEPGLLSALDELNAPHDRLTWVFDDLDAWKVQMRASSPAGVFFDDDGSVFEADIAWLARSGITMGCGPGRFCPDQKVTRGQMAAFLYRGLRSLVPATASPPGFTDVSASPFKGDIAWLASSGITRGCNPPSNTRFCPDASVTRGQMAAFLHRALDDLIG